MPIDYKNYSPDWHQISDSIRFGRAGGRCECDGECGQDHGGRCREQHGQGAQSFKGKVVLTVAHLDHDPQNNDPENLKAMCQKCHNRYDVDHRRKNRAKTRRKKILETGQMELI
jgi:hypothetical protein